MGGSNKNPGACRQQPGESVDEFLERVTREKFVSVETQGPTGLTWDPDRQQGTWYLDEEVENSPGEPSTERLLSRGDLLIAKTNFTCYEIYQDAASRDPQGCSYNSFFNTRRPIPAGATGLVLSEGFMDTGSLSSQHMTEIGDGFPGRYRWIKAWLDFSVKIYELGQKPVGEQQVCGLHVILVNPHWSREKLETVFRIQSKTGE